jgi:uridylate kinase
MPEDMKYKCVLLKLSGEALMGEKECGMDPPTLERIAGDILEARGKGTKISVVVGGGNIIRGMECAEQGMDRATCDYMGMLATLINALALQETLIRRGHEPALFSAFTVSGIAPLYDRREVKHALAGGKIVLLAGGTGRPFFTTDTAAALRALELDCDLILKASHVDGVYDKDPYKYPDAVRYEELSFPEAVEMRLKVMDLTAFSLCWENNIPLMVFDLRIPGNLQKALAGDTSVGTIVR